MRAAGQMTAAPLGAGVRPLCAGESNAGEHSDDGGRGTDGGEPTSTRQETSLQVALGHQAEPHMTGSPALVQAGLGRLTSRFRTLSPSCGRHTAQHLTALRVSGDAKGQTWHESKASGLPAHLLAVGAPVAPGRSEATQFRPTGPGERKEERQRAQGQMSEPLFPRVPLIMLGRK